MMSQVGVLIEVQETLEMGEESTPTCTAGEDLETEAE
jgi:hypothetical protein